MDINSKKFQTTVSRFKKFRVLINILLVVISVVILFFVNNKRDALLIVSLIIFIKVSIVYMWDNIKVLFLLQDIREMGKMNYCVHEMLEQTNEKSDVCLMLGKKYRKVLGKIHQVEKYIYETTLKGKQSEKMESSVTEDIGKNLIEPVKNINEGIRNLKENLNNETLDYIENEVYKMKDTINELFELSKSVTKSLNINIEKIDLVSLINQALIKYEGKLEKQNIKIKKHMPNEKIYINADGDKLWRVLQILLDNILSHSKENTRAYVNLKENKGNMELTLINISSKELNIDTNEFYKIIRGNNNLGIPIATSLIESQDGKLDIDIDGDMFKVTLLFKCGNDLGKRGKI